MNMDKICRICLKEGVLSSIFTKNYNVSLCDMIEYCCNMKITEGDGLPEQICSNCIYKLGIGYHFKHTCESGDVRLRQYLGLQKPAKYADACVATDPIPPTHTTIIKKCKCRKTELKRSTNYRRKPESEKQKRGPKPKPKEVHACYQCNKEFRCQAQLEMHVRTHTGDKPFICMYCPRRFTQKHNLTIHLRIHTGEKPFQCEICSKRFSAQGNLHAHLKIHTGQKDHVCMLCSKSFITSSELTRHMSKHGGSKNFKCELCEAAYVHARDLKLHKMKKHQIAPQNTNIQSECFNNSNNIDVIGIDVGKDPPLPLPIKDVNHLIPHLINEKPQLVMPVAPIQCPLSAAIEPYNQKGKDIFHQYSKNVESHNCAICGEKFDFLTTLAQHYLHRHTDYDPLQPKCYGITQNTLTQ